MHFVQHVGRNAPTDLDNYELDLRWFIVIRNALSTGAVDELDAAYDRFPDLTPREWYGGAQRRYYTLDTGVPLDLHST